MNLAINIPPVLLVFGSKRTVLGKLPALHGIASYYSANTSIRHA